MRRVLGPGHDHVDPVTDPELGACRLEVRAPSLARVEQRAVG
ncbi:MAG TPA: hypothetical protein VN180_09165 [Acidimicrobiia bacterium]|nr:hypothetical protein [Acidimicrobiia bacterium]